MSFYPTAVTVSRETGRGSAHSARARIPFFASTARGHSEMVIWTAVSGMPVSSVLPTVNQAMITPSKCLTRKGRF